MAGTTPRAPELFRPQSENLDFVVSELVSDAAGSHSPWGDIDVPMPVATIWYRHPGPAERPHLAEGR
jgi:hypothetical protein